MSRWVAFEFSWHGLPGTAQVARADGPDHMRVAHISLQDVRQVSPKLKAEIANALLEEQRKAIEARLAEYSNG